MPYIKLDQDFVSTLKTLFHFTPCFMKSILVSYSKCFNLNIFSIKLWPNSENEFLFHFHSVSLYYANIVIYKKSHKVKFISQFEHINSFLLIFKLFIWRLKKIFNFFFLYILIITEIFSNFFFKKLPFFQCFLLFEKHSVTLTHWHNLFSVSMIIILKYTHTSMHVWIFTLSLL